MKISILLIFISAFNLLAEPGYSQSEKISLKLTNVNTIENVISEIERTTDYVFIYNEDVISTLKNEVDVEVSNQSIDEILNQLIKGTDLGYSLSSKQVTLYKDESKKVYAQIFASAPLLIQQQTKKAISGKVVDAKGEAIIGANIIEKGTTNGTITDIDGNFSLNVSDDAVLRISYIGYLEQEIVTKNRSTVNITLLEDTQAIDELVVVGYGIMQKKDLTGAVSVINIQDVSNTPVAGVDQMMQGRVPGVNVIGDYAPGGGVSVRVRGFSTIRNNDPLYIIDGVPVESGINMINPNDIESLQILKDASSTSIYGSRAANGVVIITTKKGKNENATINFDAYFGVQDAANQLTPLSAQQYGDLLWEAHYNDGKTPSNDIYGSGSTATIPQYIDQNNRVPSTNLNWVDEIMQSAIVQSYNISMAKGKGDSFYNFSMGYFDQEGIVKYTDFKRVSARFNSQSTFFDKLVIGENLSVSHSWANQTETNSVLGSVVYEAYQYPSIAPVYDLDGNFAGAFMNDIRNPLAKLYHSRDNTHKQLKLFGNVFAELEVFDGFKLRSNFGIDYGTSNFRDFDPKFQETGAQRPSNISSLLTNNSWKFDWVWTNTMNYLVTFDKHQIAVLAGMEAIKSIYEGFNASREGFPYEEKNFRYLDAGDGGTQKNRGTGLEWSLISYMAKTDYIFDNRYLTSFTFRRDGSSKLGNNNWGNFSAFSLGWRISEENFFTFDKVSNLKLRFGWGQNGNQDVPPYATIESYYSNSYYSNYAVDGDQFSVVNGFTQSRNGNNDLKWETTTQSNFGFDLGFLNNRFNITADYFIKNTKDLLLERPLPPVAGGTNQTVWDNVGEMQNKGIELLFGYQSKQINDFSWNAELNFSHIKNELTSLSEDIDFIALPSSYLHNVNFDQETSRSEVGQPISSFYGYRSLGIFQNQAEIDAHKVQPNAQPGDLKFEDVDKNGILNGDDRTFIGDPHPDFTLGLNVGMQYKDFDISLFFNGSFGNDVWDLTRYYGDFYNLSAYNKLDRTLNAWSEDNTSASVPRLSLDDPNNNIRPSSYYISDASYVRLKNLTVGYSLNNLARKLNSTRMRIYVQVQNLFTITGYKGLDPEVGLQNYSSEHRNLDIGVDRGLYPPSRTYTIGLNLNF